MKTDKEQQSTMNERTTAAAASAAAQQQRKKDAAAYNCSGVHFPGHIAPFGQVNHGDMGQHTDAIFAAMHFANHWRHTYNVDFFKNESFPFLKLVAEWWVC